MGQNPQINAAQTLRVAPVLSRVVYLHGDGKTWERVPFQVFAAKHGVVCVRVGQNVYDLSAVTWGESGGGTRIGGMVEDWHPDPGPGKTAYNRGALFRARHDGGDDPGKPLLPRSDWRSKGERAEWEAEKRRHAADRRAWKRSVAEFVKWKPSPAQERERKRHVGDDVFGAVLRPFVCRNLTDARAAYRALCNIVWKRVADGRAYSCSWRHAGALVANLRDRNEFYLDFYCGGGEERVAKRLRVYMAKRGWVPVEWDAWQQENGLKTA